MHIILSATSHADNTLVDREFESLLVQSLLACTQETTPWAR